MDKRVTITANGITQSVLESELSFYARAGYKVVEEAPVVVEAEDPEPVVEAEEKPARVSRKK